MSQVALGAAALVGGTQACGDDTTAAKIRAAQLAEACSIDSDCVDPLTCAFSHCHVECTTDRDCRDVGGRCVRAPEGVGVCQLESERDCTTDASCVGDQVCAVDQQCRDLCSERHPCIEGLVCAASGECAEPQEVDASGKLSGEAGSGATGGGGTGGKGGSAGRGGTSGHGVSESGGAAGDQGSGATTAGGSGTSAGSGASSGEGGEAGTSGPEAGGSGGTSSGGAAGSAGHSSAGSGGTMSGGGQGGASGVVAEQEPNDDRAAPMPIAPVGVVNASFATSTDVDYYELVTPATDTAGGYYAFTFTGITDGQIRFQVQSELDFNAVFGDTISGAIGASAFGYWASASDQHFLIRCAPYNGQSFPYDYKLTVNYVPVPDTAEPDDTRQTARSVNVGDAVQGYLYSGYQGSSVNVDEYVDYYAVTLSAGSYTVHVTDVPSTVNIGLYVFDSTGTTLDQTWQATKGADLLFTHTVSADGKYYFQVSYFNGAPSLAATTSLPGQVPDSYTHPYTFQVTQ